MECWIIIIVQEKKCLVDLTLREKSRRSEVFSKKVVLRNFVKFTGKHLCQFLFLNKVVDMRPATLLKKRLWHRCFPVNFTKFLRTPLLTEHLWWLLLERAWAMLFRWLKFNLNLVRNFKPKWWRILNVKSGVGRPSLSKVFLSFLKESALRNSKSSSFHSQMV